MTDGSACGIVKAMVDKGVADTTQDGQLEDYPELDPCGCTEMEVNSALSTKKQEKLLKIVSLCIK